MISASLLDVHLQAFVSVVIDCLKKHRRSLEGAAKLAEPEIDDGSQLGQYRSKIDHDVSDKHSRLKS
jgi:hypothetical protein